MKALFDTNILIDYLNGVEGVRQELALHRDRLVSVITWMEVLAGARSAEEEEVIEMFLREFTLVDITRRTAREAITLRRSHRLRLPDAIIWASARTESALLVTRNTKDFPVSAPGVRVPAYSA
ncbi:MAG: type II toxin-antitoxin system VapC family toxin [Acidobacteriota bacterium]